MAIDSRVYELLSSMKYEDVLASIDLDRVPDYDSFLELINPVGNIKRAATNNIYGINHRGLKAPIPENRDTYGMTFFTRPQLNLSNYNLKRHRKFYSMLNNDHMSVARMVRCMLDPRLGMKDILNRMDFMTNEQKRIMDSSSSMAHNANVYSPLVDPNMGFIPMLTNNLLSLDGWPDVTLPGYTTDGGLKKEQWIMADGHVDIYDSYNLTGVFRNTRDEPIIMLFKLWETYIAYVFEGLMSPYLDMIANNEMDYNTRIYRLVMDETRMYVKKIAACGAAYPENVPTGKMFDFSDESFYNLGNKEIDISFKCVGAEFYDDITIKEFNMVSAIFNSDVRAMLNNQKHNLIKIPRSLLLFLNHRGYPIINQDTLELEWYINQDSKDLLRILSYIKL